MADVSYRPQASRCGQDMIRQGVEFVASVTGQIFDNLHPRATTIAKTQDRGQTPTA